MIPPALSIASYALDGASYLATGKSATDHALSEALGMNCATFRVIKGESPCRDFTYQEARLRKNNRAQVRYNDARGMVASNNVVLGPKPVDEARGMALAQRGKTDGLPARTQKRLAETHEAYVNDRQGGPATGTGFAKGGKSGTGAGKKPGRRSDLKTNRNLAAGAAPRAQVAQLRLKPEPPAKPRRVASKARTGKGRERYVVLGSFPDRGDARRMVRRFPMLDPVIIPAEVRGRTYYRVAVRPGSRTDLASAMHLLKRKGVRGAYTMRVCTGATAAANCIQRDPRSDSQMLARRERNLRKGLKAATGGQRSEMVTRVSLTGG